jgi:carboxynorspermidine decarboxylase
MSLKILILLCYNAMTHIQSDSFFRFNPNSVPSPCFVVDEARVENNLRILNDVQTRSGAKILMALKAFSLFALSPLFNRYLSGTCSSGIYEAQLACQHFAGQLNGEHKREVHIYNPAYKADDIDYLLTVADHIVFNSASQWLRFKDQCIAASAIKPTLRFGLRINPQQSTAATSLYDPCAAGSRLGINIEEFNTHFSDQKALEGISGLHCHTLCEQGFDALSITLQAIESQFSAYLPHLQWLNLGGGHHITHKSYDRESLIQTCQRLQQQYALQVYLEPGEAAVIGTGVLVTEVLDLPHNHIDLAIVDSSATCHMPDTIEMPYRANILIGQQKHWPDASVAGLQNEKHHMYRLGGQTCLAGDVMGDYSFDQALTVGQRLMFDDMSHYTMVKTTTFNGMPLPTLALWNSNTHKVHIIKDFNYHDFYQRLS